MIIQIHVFAHIFILHIAKCVSSSLFVEIFRNKVYVPFLGSLYLATQKKHEMSIDSFVILKLLKEINFESNWWDRKLVIISPLTDGEKKKEMDIGSHFRPESNLNLKIMFEF